MNLSKTADILYFQENYAYLICRYTLFLENFDSNRHSRVNWVGNDTHYRVWGGARAGTCEGSHNGCVRIEEIISSHAYAFYITSWGMAQCTLHTWLTRDTGRDEDDVGAFHGILDFVTNKSGHLCFGIDVGKVGSDPRRHGVHIVAADTSYIWVKLKIL